MTEQQSADLLDILGIREMIAERKFGRCPFCHKQVQPEQFRNEISLREYRISGLCQGCQDEMFGVD
jgi:hypothetical protein